VSVIGRHNSLIVVDFLMTLQHQMDELDKVVHNEIENAVRSQQMINSMEQSQMIIPGEGNMLKQMIEDGMNDIQSITSELHHEIERIQTENAELSSRMSRIQRNIDELRVLSTNSEMMFTDVNSISIHRNCRNIIREYIQHLDIATFPMYETEKLTALLCSTTGISSPRCWSSIPFFDGFPSFTVTFMNGISMIIRSYELKSTLGWSGIRIPYMRSWKLYGIVEGKWKVIDEQNCIDILSDAKTHDFVISHPDPVIVDGIRLMMTGRNRLGSSQMHLAKLTLIGDVLCPMELRNDQETIACVSPNIDVSLRHSEIVSSEGMIFDDFESSLESSRMISLPISPEVEIGTQSDDHEESLPESDEVHAKC
jgi:hypothetical protein